MDKIAQKLEQILAMQKHRAQAERVLNDARHSLAVEIQRLDEEIDALVYKLYGLTEEEIKVVAGANR